MSRLLVANLSAIFNAAVRDRFRSSNPCHGVSLPRSQSERIVPLTIDQVQDLADAIDPRCRATVITQAGLGLRIAELLALRVEDVDFLRRNVKIDCQLTQDAKQRVEPKTPRSRRTVPLPSVVAEALSEHIRQFPPAEDGSWFTTERGNLYRQEHYQARPFRKAVRAAGLPADCTPHAMRHHYVSGLLAAGASVVEVAERIGDTPQMVMRVYGHLLAGSEDRTRRAIDAAWTDKSAPVLEPLTIH
jgi:integrase